MTVASVIQVRCGACDGGAYDRQRAGGVCVDCGGVLAEKRVPISGCAWCSDRALCSVHGCYRRYGMAERLAALNAVPKSPEAGEPFGPVVIQFPAQPGGGWWLMRAGEDRHSHFAYSYADLSELLKAWRVTVTGTGRDAAGSFFTCAIEG